jgi:uncharacterized protein YehS (DUF1456 family)
MEEGVGQLQRALAEKEAELQRLSDEIAVLRQAIAILGEGHQIARPPPNLTIGDAAEIVLRKTGSPLHVTLIAQELKKLGFDVTKEQVSTAVRKDRRKRFRGLGRNTFELLTQLEDKK